MSYKNDFINHIINNMLHFNIIFRKSEVIISMWIDICTYTGIKKKKIVNIFLMIIFY